jgi:hypothetical protein
VNDQSVATQYAKLLKIAAIDSLVRGNFDSAITFAIESSLSSREIMSLYCGDLLSAELLDIFALEAARAKGE